MNAPKPGTAPGQLSDNLLAELDLKEGFIVQELGWDEDVDFDFRDSLEDQVGEEFLTEEDQEPVDAVLMWWRSDEGDVQDLTDALVDATTNLDNLDHAAIWLLTPRASQEGHVSTVDITEAAETAGLKVATSAGVSADWAATRLEPRN